MSTSQTDKPKRKRGWSRWHPAVLPLLWGLFSVLGFYASGWLMDFVYFVLPFQSAGIQDALLLVGRAGLLAGGIAWLQRLTLQAGYGVNLRGWVRATIIGSLLAGMVSTQILPFVDWRIGIVSGSVLSNVLTVTIIALAQWSVLRRTSQRAWVWLPLRMALAAGTLAIILLDRGQTLSVLQPLLLDFFAGAIGAAAMLWIQELVTLPRRRVSRAHRMDDTSSHASHADTSRLDDVATHDDTNTTDAETTSTAQRANWS